MVLVVPDRGVIAGAADARIEHLGRQVDVIEVAVIVVLQGLQVRQGVLGDEGPPLASQVARPEFSRRALSIFSGFTQLLSVGNVSLPSLKACSIPSFAPAKTIPRFLYVVSAVNALYVVSLYVVS